MKAQPIFLTDKKRAVRAIRPASLLKKYFANRMETIGEILNLPLADLTHDIVHQLRIEIKKVKALFVLIKNCKKEFPHNKFSKPFNQLFDQAGAWRALQVQQRLLKEYKAYTLTHKFTSRLNGLHHLEQKKFESLVRSGIFKKLNRHKKEITSHIRRIKTQEFIAQLQKGEVKLNKLIARNLFSEHKFHTIRKSLKFHYFNVRSLDLERADTEPWVGLMELLGGWHDLEIAHDYLIESIYCSEHKPSEEKRLRKIKRDLLSNKEQLVEQIIAAYLKTQESPVKQIKTHGRR